jgi:hypothetical protein
MNPELTHQDVALPLARVLLTVADNDEPAVLAALIDAASDGVDAAAILVVTAQALIVHMEHANPAWREPLRQSLLQAQGL